MTGRKSTLKVNKLPEKEKLPVYTYSVCVTIRDAQMESQKSPFLGMVDVLANSCSTEGDDLCFHNSNENEEEVMVACFKEWVYFLRKDADLMEGAKEWGEKFELLVQKEDKCT